MKQVESWWLPDDDEHFEFHLKQGPYQGRKIELALALVPDNRRCLALDIGAHVGFWTEPLAGIFERVIAWEPMPELAICWQRNCEDLRNVECRQCAVGSDSGELGMIRTAGNSGNCHIAVGSATVVVRAETIDSLALEHVDFMKFDVEGWELEAVRGAEETIKQCKPLIVVEQKPGNAERYGMDQHGAVNLLKSWGATTHWIKAGDHCMGWSS
jgi:FkbM family methyltransferase